MKTQSESLFESLCDARGVNCERIKTLSGKSTPDYRIWLGKIEAFVEIKQLELGDFEHELRSNADDRLAPATLSSTARRIRGKFDKAKPQLRNFAKDKIPAIFVIYDHTNGLSGIESEDFLNAMYGDEIILISFDKDPTNLSISSQHRFGGHRKVDRGHNRFMSAFAHLIETPGGEPRLVIYHNDYDDLPLDPRLASKLAHVQYKRQSGETSKYRGWDLILD